jgi:glycogen(starch) synthase
VALTARPTALWVLPVGHVAGVGRHAVDIARVGIPGWRTAFLAPEGPVVEALREVGASVTVAAFGPAYGLRSSLGALRRAVDTIHPDLVHTHLSYADVVGALAKRHGNVLVTTEHGLDDDNLVHHGSRAGTRAGARLHQARVHRADALIAVSEATLRVARTKWRIPARIPQRVIYNGIDPVPPTTRPEPGLHVVSLARLSPEKRLPDLVSGFALLAEEYAEARLTLAGVGELEHELRRQVTRLGLDGQVSLPGAVDTAELLGRAHVLAQLSIWENCSYPLLDACVQRIGIVASPVGGNPEVLPRRSLVDPTDHEAVAHRLADQGLETSRRPDLPPGWPDVATMAALVAEVYAEVS